MKTTGINQTRLLVSNQAPISDQCYPFTSTQALLKGSSLIGGGLTEQILYARYDTWAKDRGFETMNTNAFGGRLLALGLKHRHSNGNTPWCANYCANATAAWFTSAFNARRVAEAPMYSNRIQTDGGAPAQYKVSSNETQRGKDFDHETR